ncbi:DUF3168 domain-containing protein [Roseibium sp.]|uniref:DUF3168 domain-containing protein n=1 Tax=Roseibium sp. TaxID=1936156 RepID=UPI003A97854D
MSDTPQLALRKGLFDHLAASAALTALLGPGRIFDKPPRGQGFPFLVLEGISAEPLLSDPDEGLAHELRLVALSRTESRDEALTIAETAGRALMENTPVVPGHHLVGLQISGVASQILRDGRTFRAELTLRAVTEPAG